MATRLRSLFVNQTLPWSIHSSMAIVGRFRNCREGDEHEFPFYQVNTQSWKLERILFAIQSQPSTSGQTLDHFARHWASENWAFFIFIRLTPENYRATRYDGTEISSKFGEVLLKPSRVIASRSSQLSFFWSWYSKTFALLLSKKALFCCFLECKLRHRLISKVGTHFLSASDFSSA